MSRLAVTARGSQTDCPISNMHVGRDRKRPTVLCINRRASHASQRMSFVVPGAAEKKFVPVRIAAYGLLGTERCAEPEAMYECPRKDDSIMIMNS